jgi:hypothetical protein
MVGGTLPFATFNLPLQYEYKYVEQMGYLVTHLLYIVP